MPDTDALNDDEMEGRYRQVCARIPWTSPIYLPTDKIPMPARINGMSRVAEIHNDRLERIYRPQMRALRDRHAGTKRAFIIGNGPSLNRTDLSCLKDEVTFCVNGFFLKMPELDWTPTYYVVEDHLVAEDRAEAINALRGPTKLFPTYLAYCLNEGENTIFFNHRARKSYPHGFDFSTDAAKITYTGCTVTFTCMQLAHYMGFEEIYLIGVDASYAIPEDAKSDTAYGTGVLDMASDDPNHFHPDYFGKGYRWHDPQVEQMIQAYEEARRVTDASGRRIFNATIGGALEVFERRAFQSVFPDAIAPEAFDALGALPPEQAAERRRALTQEARHARSQPHLSRYPRLAIIDMTPVGGVTATGAIKATLLADWPRERLLHISSESTHDIVVDGAFIDPDEPPARYAGADDVLELIGAFDPDVLLYRPLPDKPALHDLALQAVETLKRPLVTWIMDDWLARLARTDEARYRALFADMQRLTGEAAVNLSISEPMSAEMKARFGTEFHAIANGIDPAQWPDPAPRTGEEVVIRYSGGLAPDMSLDSIIALAEIVEMLATQYPVRLDILTRQHWFNRYGEVFERYGATHMSSETLDDEEYRAWLQDADIVVVAYNFDPHSLEYVRFSMANKLPELLATGRPVLAIGPSEIATIAHLQQAGVGHCVTQDNDLDRLRVVETLVRDRALRVSSGAAGRAFAIARHDIAHMRAAFEDSLRAAARRRTAAPAETPPGRIGQLLARRRNQPAQPRQAGVPAQTGPANVRVAQDGPIRREASAAQADFEVKVEFEPLPPGQTTSAPDARSAAPARTPAGPVVAPAEPDARAMRRAGSRILRITKFFLGWRGLVAVAALAGIASPALIAPPPETLTGWAGALGPTLGAALLFVMMGYFYTLIVDHAREAEYRLERMERRQQNRR